MQEHKEWLKFAADDLYAAKKLLDSDYIVIGAVCYHAQQCAEKTFKAYLVFKKIRPKRTHDLPELLLECAEFDEEIKTLMEDALEINPFAHKTRYPDSSFVMEISIAESAIKHAENIYDLIASKIW